MCAKMNGGWREAADDNLKPYLRRSHELTVEDGCLLCRVVIPKDLRGELLEELHDCHPGVKRMKALARSYLWWPGMDGDIETMVKAFRMFQLHQNNTAKSPVHPWEWTSKPCVTIHIDYAGPFLYKMFLLLIDSHSKWLEVVPTSGAGSKETIKILRSVFATHGLPEQCVSDNNSAFTSIEVTNSFSGME